MQEELQKLGLSTNEIKVFISLLDIGETKIGSIIKDIGIHRQSVYNALDGLEKKGFVLRNTKNGINHYKIANPTHFVEKIKQQEIIATHLGKIISTQLQKSEREHEITVYEGRNQIRTHFINLYKNMPQGSFLYVISNYANRFEEVLGHHYLRGEYNDLVMKKRIKIKIIAGEKMYNEYKDLLKKLDQETSRKIRFIPDAFIPPRAIQVTTDIVDFVSFAQNWFIIEIKNKEYSNAYIKYFNNLWKVAKNK